MKNLIILLKNKIILVIFVALIAVSGICAANLSYLLNQMEHTESQLAAMEWVIPMRTYDNLYIAEVKGEVYFAGVKERNIEILDAEGMPATDMKGIADAKDTFYKLEVRIHPDGYWLDYGSDVGGQTVKLVDGNDTYFAETAKESALFLTEKPGYAIDMESNTVIDLKTGEVLFRAKPDERIVRQDGDFWIMERDIPWPTAGLTLTYLRNMDFEMALDGMLFDGIWDIDKEYIVGTVITTGTYDQLPEEVIAVENCVMDTSGKIVFSDADTESGDLIILGADEGYFFALEDHERYRMYFTDGGEFLDFAEGYEPVGPYRNGVFAFTTGEDKYGFKNRHGETVIPPIFDLVSKPCQGMAVVQRGSAAGVIRLEGGADHEE